MKQLLLILAFLLPLCAYPQLKDLIDSEVD